MALFFLPIIALGAYSAIAFVGGLTLLWVSKIAENSTDYSLQNTVRQALFLVTTREAKYKAKAAIDTFFVRIGDTMSAGVVALGIHVLAFSESQLRVREHCGRHVVAGSGGGYLPVEQGAGPRRRG